jgi:hypothetical protein
VFILLGGGCADSKESSGDPPPTGCAAGPGRPIGVEAVISTLRRHGFDVVRDEECMTPEDVATLTSDYSEKSQDEVEREDGHVICIVVKRVHKDGRVRRTKYPEDEETYVDVQNVSCAIYPSTEPGAAERQIARLERALTELARRVA